MSWEELAVTRINCLPGRSPKLAERRLLARRILRQTEITDPTFPAPRVRLADSGVILLHWNRENSPRGPCTLDVHILDGRRFRGCIWFPGHVGDVVEVAKNHTDALRRLLGVFWPEANSHELADLLSLSEVTR